MHGDCHCFATGQQRRLLIRGERARHLAAHRQLERMLPAKLRADWKSPCSPSNRRRKPVSSLIDLDAAFSLSRAVWYAVTVLSLTSPVRVRPVSRLTWPSAYSANGAGVAVCSLR